MFFEDIPGQQSAKDYLVQLVDQNRIPHAMLFVGNEGQGKMALVTAFVNYLLCQNKQNGQACKICKSCKQTNEFVHPDVHFSFPVIKKDKLKREDTTSQHFLPEWRSFLKDLPYGDINSWLSSLGALDKQANINVAECNHMIKNLSLQAYSGGYKIQIVWMAEYLGKEGNRILKLIEEPTDDTVIILISNDKERLLNTIISRCQLINIPPFGDNQIQSYLKDKWDLEPEDAQELAFMAAGNLRKAIQLADHQGQNFSEDLLDWIRVAYTSDPEKIIAFIDNFSSIGKQQLINFIEYGLHFFQEYLHLINGFDLENLRLTNTEKQVAQKMQKIIDANKTSTIRTEFESAIMQIKRNLSVKVLLMKMTIEINHILKSEVNKFVP